MLPSRLARFKFPLTNIRTSSTVPNVKEGDSVSVERKITQKDIKEFSELSGDFNPVHFDSEHQKPVVHGALLNSIVSGVIGTKLPGPGTLVVAQTLHFPNKCYVDETVRVEVKLLEKRKILKVEFTCRVDNNKIVLYGDARLVTNKAV